MLAPDRIAELRRVAEAAARHPTPGFPHRLRFEAEFTPGVALMLLDMIPEPPVPFEQPKCLTPVACASSTDCMVSSGCTDDPRLADG